MSITLTPLAPPHHPPTYLLTVDSAKILLDCGTFDHSPSPSSSPLSSSHSAATANYLATLRELAPILNLVLLTHALLTSLGLLPYLKAKCGLRCPVYATLPTREMGRWAVEEWVEQRSEEERNEGRDVVVAKAVEGKKGRKGKARELESVVLETVKMEEEDGDGVVEKKEEDRGDPWDVVWKVTTKEIRDAFLTVNAVRWTQPVHLSGSYSFLSSLIALPLIATPYRPTQRLHSRRPPLGTHPRRLALHSPSLPLLLPLPRILFVLPPLRTHLQSRQGTSSRRSSASQWSKDRRRNEENGRRGRRSGEE
jgi:hypothetical protein